MMSNCGRCRPTTASASTMAKSSSTPAIPMRCGRRWPAWRPAMSPGYEAFLKASEARFRIGFERLGHVPFSGWTDMARVLPDLVRLAGHRSVYDLVSPSCPRPAPAGGAELPSAAGRRQPLRHDLDLQPDRVSGAALGRAFRHGRHRIAGPGAGRADRGAGRHRQVRRGDHPHPRHRRARGRRPARVGRGDRGGCGGLQRRQRLDLPASGGAGGAAALDRQADRERPLFHEPVRLVLRHKAAIRGRGAPHHPARPALSRAAARHLRAQGAGAGLQPLSPPPDRDRPVAGAARMRCLLRAVPGAASG